MYKYETHSHTWPVSLCARTRVEESLAFYKALGYDGVFITNHFLDGNINIDKSLPYEEQIAFYFSDYEEGLRIGKKLGIRVFFGAELSYGGTDFLVYGLDKAWFLAHPEIMELKKSRELTLLADSGALIIQAHPFREAAYIDHIRLFPRHIHGVEVNNACRKDPENRLAEIYADHYGLLPFAGTDNHLGPRQEKLAGVCFETPIESEADFVRRVLNREAALFSLTVAADPANETVALRDPC